MSYRRVIVGTDRSPTARRAEDVGKLLARAHDAELVLIHASNDPAETLVGEATNQDGDLIVVGSKGMTGTGRLLGSVPNAVSHSARSDVLIVKTTIDQKPRQYRKVLIATDGSETAIQAARKGVDLCRRLGAESIMFYAGHPATAPIVFQEVERELPSASYSTESSSGDPASVICDTALAGQYDLIVLGNRGMTGNNRKGSSVPDKVSHRTPCDLLLVRTVATSIESLRKGEGAVVKDEEGEKLAVFKDASGRLHKFSARCSHMGCIVGWNSAESTWDCPCHGSRYAAEGAVVQGPALNALTRLDN